MSDTGRTVRQMEYIRQLEANGVIPSPALNRYLAILKEGAADYEAGKAKAAADYDARKGLAADDDAKRAQAAGEFRARMAS